MKTSKIFAVAALSLAAAVGVHAEEYQGVQGSVSALSRADVQAQAVATPPASGAFDGQAYAQGGSSLTRAEVRAQAIANPPASGLFDSGTVAQQYQSAPTHATGE